MFVCLFLKLVVIGCGDLRLLDDIRMLALDDIRIDALDRIIINSGPAGMCLYYSHALPVYFVPASADVHVFIRFVHFTKCVTIVSMSRQGMLGLMQEMLKAHREA